MSDENENEPEGHFIFPFQFGPTKAQIEQMQMHQEANAHETRQFFDSLTEDQLRRLSSLFAICYTSDGDASQYYIGIISGFLDQKFKICLACGRNHDVELKAFSEAQPVDLTPTQRQSLLDMYELEIVGERFYCKGCHKEYVSLEDRMLRDAGQSGCEGCIEKEKWG